ncbi:MAG: ABC transporter, periplasmic spermidine putrescine-binding protein PotD (TC 3.A.1.11.1) [uncultured Thiotrichaceae bacterium]|uniref:Putrescine-binding periplasmic protein n=1 Tax=uncultured Thiotrichaceae bacterium TaxID=298394 RepID=A0A6S6UFC8_9GAMM|nr:MAG: ABC transporter, periplasmic spermidine putrescine-binding protein PotD (TC 3.A.1.11.1) [uncultured Thiotrichaceae bacterium]
MRYTFFFISMIFIFTVKPVLALGATVGVEEKVIVYNWSDYIPEGVLDSFTEETGIKVEYSTYNNNEIMYQKLKLLKGRGYDILVPSTSLVDRMRNEGLIQPINHTKLENFKLLNPSLLNKFYDPNNEFSIPYLWGSTGIAVNAKKIDPEKVQSWEDLWHVQWRNQILLTDDMRDAFDIALKVNGHSINTTIPEEIKQAFEKLRSLMSNVKMLSVEPRIPFQSGDINLGVIWNGEAVTAHADQSSVQYIYPKEGASFWVDSFVIPARAMNVENAHKFIDYMLRPDVAARCVEDLGYATPNLAAKALLDKKTRENPTIFPPYDVLKKVEFKRDIGKAMELYMLYWGKLKTQG